MEDGGAELAQLSTITTYMTHNVIRIFKEFIESS